jgi:hypothetical protein
VQWIGGSSQSNPTRAPILRLTRERDEAVEQQRATSEVPRAISNSPIDTASILGAIAEGVARLLEVTDAENPIAERCSDNPNRVVGPKGSTV